MKTSALRDLREAARLSRDELATRAGISKRSIASYELDGAQPNMAAAIALADALGVTLDEIAGRPVAAASGGEA